MVNKQPKTKLEEFKEKLINAKSKEELAEIAKKLENFVKLFPSDEGYYLLSYSKYQIGDIDGALKWIQYAKSIEARLFEIIINISASEFKKAYNLVKELEKSNLGEAMEKELKTKEVLILWSMGEYEKVLNLWDENIKQSLLDSDIELGYKVIKKIEGYQKAKEKISSDKKLKKAIDKIKEIVSKEIPQSKIVPIIETDMEYPVEDLWVYILVPEAISYEEIETIEEKIIDEIIFNEGIDINYLFTKTGETEFIVQT